MYRKKEKFSFYLTKVYFFIITFYFIFLFVSPGYALIKDKVNLGLIGKWGYRGAIRCLEIMRINTPQGDKYACCGTNNGFLIINVTHPNMFKEIAFLDIGEVNDVMLYKTNYSSPIYAALATSKNGLYIVDISNPSKPIYAGRYDTRGDVNGLTIKDNYAYLADIDKGIVIINIGDPTEPIYAGSYNTQGEPCHLTIRDNYAYVADRQKGLVIIDISDPSRPLYSGGYDAKGEFKSIAVKGNYA